MRKQLFLTALCLGLAPFSFCATPTLLEGFEDTVIPYTTVASGSDVLTTSVVSDHSQGAGSMLLSLAYQPEAAWYKNSYVRKTFASPMDMRAVEYMALDLKVPVADPNFMMVIMFTDELGYQMRVVDYAAFTTVASDWATHTWKVSDLQKSRWANLGRPVNLAKIVAISFHIQNGGELTAAGTFSWQMDNFQMFSDVGIRNETVLEDFESYADNAALNAVWTKTFGGTVNDPSLETAAPYAGTKSMSINENIAAQYTNHAAIMTFASPRDFSAAAYFKMAVAGDTKLAGYTPTAHLYLVDSSGNRIISFTWNWPAQAGWHEMLLPFQADGIEGYTDAAFTLAMGGNSTWRQDRWDGGAWDANCDLTQISKMILSIELQAAVPSPINGVKICFDNVTVGYAADDVPAPETPSVKSHVVNSGVAAIDGVVAAGEWDGAGAAATGFVQHNANTVAAIEDVQVKAMFDNTNLYLLLQTTNNNFSLDFAPTGGGRDPVGTSFSGDDFEFFLAPAGNMGTNYYHVVFFPNQADSICYVWDEFNVGGASSWNGSGDQAAFTFNPTSKLLTIEYRIPWTAFNNPSETVTVAPADGAKWGVQIGYINNNPAEAVNWEPDATAGFAAGRPYGTFEFNVVTTTAAADWALLE